MTRAHLFDLKPFCEGYRAVKHIARACVTIYTTKFKISGSLNEFLWLIATLEMDELIDIIYFKLRACSPGQNNKSIHLLTNIGHDPRRLERTPVILSAAKDLAVRRARSFA